MGRCPTWAFCGPDFAKSGVCAQLPLGLVQRQSSFCSKLLIDHVRLRPKADVKPLADRRGAASPDRPFAACATVATNSTHTVRTKLHFAAAAPRSAFEKPSRLKTAGFARATIPRQNLPKSLEVEGTIFGWHSAFSRQRT